MWEPVHGDSCTSRMQVPNGWLYRYVIGSVVTNSTNGCSPFGHGASYAVAAPPSVSLCFVPDANVPDR